MACQPQVWQARLQDSRLKGSSQLQGALLQKYLQECHSELETGADGSFENARRMMSMNYEIQQHPFLRRVVVQLPGNIQLKGLLALKGDFKRRPFVVMRLGIFGSVEEFRPERAWLMMLFEQSPFNVLVLENMSSGDFVANNNQFSFGGYDEGVQNILVAKMLRDANEPLAKLVDSVHFFGVSLGGHGVLFSSLLSKYNSFAHEPLIQSSMAFCPVVDLHETMKKLTKGRMNSALVDVWARRRLHELEKKMPAVASHESFGFLDKVVSEVARNYTGGLSYNASVLLPPGMKDGANFWALNDFWRYYQDVQEPVLVLATSQDPLVPYAFNSQALASKKANSRNIRVVEMAQGVHCTLPVAYDWKFMASVMQSYILSHSAHFKMTERNLAVDLSDEEWKGFFAGPIAIDLKVREPAKDQKFVRLRINLTNSRKEEHSMNLSLPLSEFDFRFLNPELTPSEKQMIVRWLNQNLHVDIQQASDKSGMSQSPVLKVTWPVAL